jgi:hypothetical protein
MPPRSRADTKQLSLAISDLLASARGLLAATESALAEGRRLQASAVAVGSAAKSAGKKIAAKVKASWARLSPAQRKARVAKMHAWRKKRKRR